MQFDKVNGNVAFVEKSHEYFNVKDPNKKYVSVTTLIGKYCQDFDKDFWSAYKALEKLLPKESWAIEKKSLLNTKKFHKEILDTYGISELEFNKAQQGILDEWDKKNREACERGTKIHAELENSFYKAGKNCDLKKFGLGGKFECRKDYSELDLEYGVYPEYLIYRESDDGILRLAGQVDLIIKQGNDIVIVDHKGLPLDTPILTSNGWSTMGDLKVGDRVFDKDGNLCNITVKSDIHHNPCYKITFDNSEGIVADVDHRWLISFQGKPSRVMTTLEVKKCLDSGEVPVIVNNKPLNLEVRNLPKNPYLLGLHLEEITEEYLLSSYKQRVSILKGIMSTIGSIEHGDFIIDSSREDIIELLGTLGIKPTIRSSKIYFNTSEPFLTESHIVQKRDSTFRRIVAVEETEIVPTQCIAVDSPSHTYLCTHSLIVTHNTNQKIEMKGGFNTATRSTAKMKYPLNNIEDCSFYHYTLQLSTYAWMLQKINPNFNIKDLILNHYDHNGNNTLYHCEYLKHDVEKMLYDYKKQLILQLHRDRRKRIEY